jgi:hypothetical protein
MTTKLTGADRFKAYADTTDLTDTHHVWDHEDGEYVADRDGRVHMSPEDARDLAAEYAAS